MNVQFFPVYTERVLMESVVIAAVVLLGTQAKTVKKVSCCDVFYVHGKQ